MQANQPKDDLKEILDIAGQNKNAAPVQDAPLIAGFEEKCPDCRGSGKFYSYAGRYIGPCFKCKGKGKMIFKQDAATRAKQRASAARSKAKLAEDLVDGFKAAFPAEWDYIDARKNSDGFFASMAQGITKWGSLTEKQLNSVRSNMLRDAQRAEEAALRKAAAPVVNLTAIHEAFAKAKASQKSPALIAGPVKIKPASATSSNPGALYVTRRKGGEYLGKIVDGKFLAVRACTPEDQAMVLEVVADPKAAAIRHGRLTGSCACCGRTLTDPASIEAGIGPICANSFGF